MSHLLHIDSSITGEASVSRALTARAAAAWRAAHPDGAVTYRDLGANPIPHLTTETGLALRAMPDQRTPAEQQSFERSVELIEEIKAADTILLGLPLYNYGAPSSIKSWIDHLIAGGLAFDPETMDGLLGDRDLIVLASRGGGYAPGTPRDGWDHAEQWLPHGLAITGLEPRFITAELTLAEVNPAMTELIPLMHESRKNAEKAIDELWAAAGAAV
ncbi:MAG TPA: NAD(P)H-dependent oxidoreductase [Conexibacter sp.]|jgi:FMN-dependent NADH-azoreductase